MPAMPPMHKEDLDAAQCGAPGCEHKNHSVLFLNGRCHMSAGKLAFFHGGSVQVVCAICTTEICTIAITDVLPSHLIRTPCHAAEVEVAYHMLDGKLHVRCNVCEKEFLTLTAAKYGKSLTLVLP